MMKLMKDLYWKKRDLVSDGFDESLDYISKIIPLKIHKFSSGTKCWTWKVPEKWIVNEAYIEDMQGNRILDMKDHPLHVVSYSLSVDKTISKEELMKHLYTIPSRPNAIPYKFKFYDKNWGFCIQHSKLKDFKKDKYKVLIDSKHEKGTLKVGDFTIKGKTNKMIALVAHLDHPAMANDDLSGCAVLVDVAKELTKRDNNYTYKCLFLPETIGSIAYLSQYESLISKFKYGIFLEMLGNKNTLALQLSRQGDTCLDRIARSVMKKKLKKFREASFRRIVGNDELVFNGPGVNIPMISISRCPYPEYHTSDDNLKIISKEKLVESKNLILDIINIIDRDYVPKRTFKGPVFLSGFGLWTEWKINKERKEIVDQIMLNLEGDKSIFEISEELKIDFDEAYKYVNGLYEKGLVKIVK